jgi:hypothetical protein
MEKYNREHGSREALVCPRVTSETVVLPVDLLSDTPIQPEDASIGACIRKDVAFRLCSIAIMSGNDIFLVRRKGEQNFSLPLLPFPIIKGRDFKADLSTKAGRSYGFILDNLVCVGRVVDLERKRIMYIVGGDVVTKEAVENSKRQNSVPIRQPPNVVEWRYFDLEALVQHVNGPIKDTAVAAAAYWCHKKRSSALANDAQSSKLIELPLVCDYYVYTINPYYSFTVQTYDVLPSGDDRNNQPPLDDSLEQERTLECDSNGIIVDPAKQKITLGDLGLGGNGMPRHERVSVWLEGDPPRQKRKSTTAIGRAFRG